MELLGVFQEAFIIDLYVFIENIYINLAKNIWV